MERKTVFLEVQSLRDDDKNVGIVFDLTNIPQTKENIKQSGVSESRKRLLINRIDQLNLIYGQDKTIFKLASETRILGGAGLCHGLSFESLKAKLYFIRMMIILILMNKYYF